jgi:lipopolysaccharide/colanic/teichoic acid biosynthesis glycosyltransferase
LWNVLRGEMSLVGPRAYLPRELRDMEGLERVVLRVRPGLTGLWQVSGRNALSFSSRVEVDMHYVQNASPWLDLYVLARTVPVALMGEGAS